MESEHPQRVGFEDLDVNLIRTCRAALASRPSSRGRLLSPMSVAGGHKSVLASLRRAEREGYLVDQRCVELRRPRVPETEATVFHARQLQRILAASNRAYPQEES